MAALDAPDGPLKGSGTLTVQVLTWTMRPRAFLNADRNEFMTDRAPNTLTSNSRRIASSGSTSIGPGVRMPGIVDQDIEAGIAEGVGHTGRPGFHRFFFGHVTDSQADTSSGSVFQILDFH